MRQGVDQVRILEFHARPLSAVIEQCIDAGLQKMVVELRAKSGLDFILNVGHHHDCLEWSYRFRPADACLVVMLLDGGLGQARDPMP